MPPIRTPLCSIDGNSKDYKYLSPYQRGQVVGKNSEGASYSKIARDLGMYRSAMYYTL
jgi:hypothetical protein